MKAKTIAMALIVGALQDRHRAVLQTLTWATVGLSTRSTPQSDAR